MQELWVSFDHQIDADVLAITQCSGGAQNFDWRFRTHHLDEVGQRELAKKRARDFIETLQALCQDRDDFICSRRKPQILARLKPFLLGGRLPPPLSIDLAST